MVVDFHKNGGRDAVFPCIVAECLAEGMAADVAIQATVSGCFFYDAECLGAADFCVRRLLACENEICGAKRFERPAQKFQCLLGGGIDGEDVSLAGLFFFDIQMMPVFLFGIMVDIAPAERQQVADPQGRVQGEDDERVISRMILHVFVVVSEHQ